MKFRDKYEKLLDKFKYDIMSIANSEDVPYVRLKPEYCSGITFVCPIDIETGLTLEQSTHSIEDAFVPNQKMISMGISSLICRHCHDSGF